MDPLTLLNGAYENTARIVAKVTADQLHAPTPCREWDVQALLNHTTGVIGRFVATADRTPAAKPGDTPARDALAQQDWIGDDPAAAHDKNTRANLDAWSRAGALEGTCVLPGGFELPAQVAAGINFIDALVHGWDLAKAIHVDATLDPDLASAALEISRMVIKDDFR